MRKLKDPLENIDPPVVGAVIFIIGIIAFLVWAIPAMIQAQEAWEQGCRDMGGIVDSTTKTSFGTGIDSKGRPITTTTTNTTYYCLVDGKIVDIK